MSIRVFLAEDHTVVRDGLKSLLSREPDIEIVGEAGNGRNAADEVDRLTPDVVVMDVSMPDLNGFEATRLIKSRHPQTSVVALSVHTDKHHVLGMLKAGACGYVCKLSAGQELVGAIRGASAGRTYLSPDVAGAVIESCAMDGGGNGDGHSSSPLGARERQVVQLLAEGHSSKEIANRLHISMRTVESHRRNIMRKLKMHSVAELTKYALREGLTSLEQ